jgi:hypothetical protein
MKNTALTDSFRRALLFLLLALGVVATTRAEWNRIKADDLASFNALIKQDKMPAVVVAAR